MKMSPAVATVSTRVLATLFVLLGAASSYSETNEKVEGSTEMVSARTAVSRSSLVELEGSSNRTLSELDSTVPEANGLPIAPVGTEAASGIGIATAAAIGVVGAALVAYVVEGIGEEGPSASGASERNLPGWYNASDLLEDQQTRTTSTTTSLTTNSTRSSITSSSTNTVSSSAASTSAISSSGNM